MEDRPTDGYFANPDKSWLVVKEDKYNEAKEIFHNTNLNITTEGKRYLGSALGNDSFLEAFVRNKVAGWVREIETLSEFAKTQPHAAFAVYTHCTLHKWSFISRTTLGISELLQPVEDAILFCLLSSLTGRDAFSPLERELIALPARLGGLGIPNPVLQVSSAYHYSKTVSDPLTSLIQQTPELSEQTVKA